MYLALAGVAAGPVLEDAFDTDLDTPAVFGRLAERLL
jgi:hypothetical protein